MAFLPEGLTYETYGGLVGGTIGEVLKCMGLSGHIALMVEDDTREQG